MAITKGQKSYRKTPSHSCKVGGGGGQKEGALIMIGEKYLCRDGIRSRTRELYGGGGGGVNKCQCKQVKKSCKKKKENAKQRRSKRERSKKKQEPKQCSRPRRKRTQSQRNRNQEKQVVWTAHKGGGGTS